MGLNGKRVGCVFIGEGEGEGEREGCSTSMVKSLWNEKEKEKKSRLVDRIWKVSASLHGKRVEITFCN